MNSIYLDFSGIKSVWELHEYFKSIFDLPIYYGRNMDALWDCLRCSFEEETTIVIKNLYSMSNDMYPIIPAIQELFSDLENEEKEVTVKYEDEGNKNVGDYLI